MKVKSIKDRDNRTCSSRKTLVLVHFCRGFFRWCAGKVGFSRPVSMLPINFTATPNSIKIYDIIRISGKIFPFDGKMEYPGLL